MDQAAPPRPTTFGEFGVALVREVLTPGFLRRQLGAALQAALDRSDVLADLGADVVALRVKTPTLLDDDGRERSFAVTVGAQLESDVGPRILGIGVDADLEVDLTVRVRVFLPAIVQFDIDPVGPDDARIRGRARGGVLRFPLFEGGDVSRLAEAVGASPAGFLAGLNRAIADSASQRRVDVIALLRESGVGPVDAVEEWTGTLAPGEQRLFPIELRECEGTALQLWAGIAAPDSGPDAPEAPATPSELELAVSDTDGTLLDELALPVRRVAPDLDTTANGAGVTARTAAAGRFRARLVNQGPRRVTYRVEQRRHAVLGEQIDFARFGEVLLRRGVDGPTVGALVGASLGDDSTRFDLDDPVPARADVSARVVEVSAKRERADVLRFALTVDADADLVLRPETTGTPVAATVRVRVTLRIYALLDPATLVVEFEPVRPRAVRLARARRMVRERWVPLPRRTLALLLRRRIAGELNQRLAHADQRFVVGELAADLPLRPTAAARERLSFSGVAMLGEPGSHHIRLAGRQRFRAKARVFGEVPRSTDVDGDLVAELALCDEHGGVWAAEQAAVPVNGRPRIVGLEFTAPRAGEWQLRIASVGLPGDLEYELQVRTEN